jgi:Mg/Co/Ni transporter MgtE
MVRKRAGWLVRLFPGEMLTATAMGQFEKEIERVVIPALFVPVIISQAAATAAAGLDALDPRLGTRRRTAHRRLLVRRIAFPKTALVWPILRPLDLHAAPRRAASPAPGPSKWRDA